MYNDDLFPQGFSSYLKFVFIKQIINDYVKVIQLEEYLESLYLISNLIEVGRLIEFNYFKKLIKCISDYHFATMIEQDIKYIHGDNVKCFSASFVVLKSEEEKKKEVEDKEFKKKMMEDALELEYMIQYIKSKV